MKTPLMSVIMPSLNMGRYLDAALRTIQRQGYPNIEVLIVDSHSTDETPDVVARWSEGGMIIKLVLCPKDGPGPARNVGLRHATGEIVAFLDPDDLWPPGKLDRQMARLSRAPKVEMVSGYVTYFDIADTNSLSPAPQARTESLFHVHLGACLYQRRTLDAIGHFDPDFLYGEDADLLYRMIESGRPWTILRTPELYYRKHDEGMMGQPTPRKGRDLARVALKSLSRRRNAGTAHIPLKEFQDFLEPA